MEQFEEFLSNPIASISSGGSIRSSIRSQVDDVLWMNELNRKLDSVSVSTQSEGTSVEIQRCAVCTLPIGTCAHTTPWLQSNLYSSMLSSVDSELDNVFGVLDKSLVVETKPEWKDIDIHHVKWADHVPRIADRIGDSFLPLSLPPERGWHSLDRVGKYLVLYGGLKFKDRTKAPEPYGSVVRPDDVEYLSDLYIYDTENLSWHTVIPKESDHRDRYSWPCGRYGHATATLDQNNLLLFGGRAFGGRYLSDTWIFSLITFSWMPVSNISDDAVRPSPRAFSAMAPSPTTRTIILYGGTNGVDIFGDIWIFKWGAKAFECEQRIDKLNVCNWNEKPDPMTEGSLGSISSELFWTREVAVGGGAPPPPRYGHKLLTIPAHPTPYGGGRKTKLQNGTFLVVVGGCCVSPSKELEGRESSAGAGGSLPASEIKKLLLLCKTLQDRYASEGNFSSTAGAEILLRLQEIEVKCGIPSEVSQSVHDIRDIIKRSAVITGRLAEMEKQTRILESDLTEAWFAAQALSLAIRNSSTHSAPTIGIHFLCVDDMAWVPQIHPKITGDIPCSRMYAGASILGDYLTIFGGIKPTALSHTIVDSDYTRIYALDLKTLVWQQINTLDSTRYLDGPIRVADSDIHRAKQQVALEKARGLAANARGGVTVELMEAEAILTVCKWRKSMLLDEQKELRPPPVGAWGFASCVIPAAGDLNYLGSRALFHGGWNNFGGIGGINNRINDNIATNKERDENFTNCMIILDCEDELERRRRLEEEFHAKLERERQEQLSRALQLEIQSLFELRMALKEEKDNQERELKKMQFEDVSHFYLSSLPPLSKPFPVQFVKANEHTIWVKWHRVSTNTVGKKLNPQMVNYYLYMSGGFVAYNAGDRVRVLPPQDLPIELTDNNSLEDNDESDDESSDQQSIVDKTEFGKPKKVLYVAKPVEKRGNHWGKEFRGTGLFTIRADDGSLEKNVPRARLRSLLLLNEEEANSGGIFGAKKNKPSGKLTKRQISYQKAQKLLKETQLKSVTCDRLAGTEWKLIYSGDKLDYAVQGLIPWDILQSEPGVTVDVNFCLRTTGVDFPENEFSDISDPVTFSTTWSNLDRDGSSNDDMSLSSHDTFREKEMKISKTKKEVIKAVLNGQKTIELERRNDVICSEGIFETFL